MAQIIDFCSRTPSVLNDLTSQQIKVLNRISICRTEYLGTYIYRCENEECGHAESRYASCKNRACSVCSWLPREKWKLQRENDLIPGVPYYHNVFTIPHEFSEMASQNMREVQTLLFKCVAETLKAFEESHCNGGQIGFLSVLHSWSTQLLNHYHIHTAIPGGYLLDGKWHDMPDYLFPAKALATMFRNKFCSGLRRLKKAGKLKFYGRLEELNNAKKFSVAIDNGYQKQWYVHVEVTKGKKPEKIMGYLANYVYKTAIDHSRIESVDENGVKFKYRSHGEDRGTWVMKELPCDKFLQLFAGHIQPHRYMRIRYYGFLAGGVKRKSLELIFAQKNKEYEAKNIKIHRSSCEEIQQMGGRMEVAKCPKCGAIMLSPWEVYKRNAGHDPPVQVVIETNQNESVCA